MRKKDEKEIRGRNKSNAEWINIKVHATRMVKVESYNAYNSGGMKVEKYRSRRRRNGRRNYQNTLVMKIAHFGLRFLKRKWAIRNNSVKRWDRRIRERNAQKGTSV